MELEFNFWDDIKTPNQYEKVIPDEKLGRLVLRLYDRIRNKTLNRYFKHQELEDVYWEVNPTNERKTIQYTQNAFGKLRHYFLAYDPLQQQYHLRDYAYRFGEMVYEHLEAEFKPSQVESICRTLQKTLELNLAENNFIDWYTNIFLKNRSDLRRQLDLLDEKVDKLVKDLSLQKLDDEVVLQLLQSISDRLDRLLDEYKQLEAAYRNTRLITIQLASHQEQQVNGDVPEIEEAITFFNELRWMLDAIRLRLHRIHPKIQQLFGIFRQANFRARTDRFIRFLFDESKVVNGKVVLPTRIEPFTWRIHKLQLWYFDVSRNLFPPPPQPRPQRVVDPVAREQAFIEATEIARRQDEAHIWLDHFHAELEKNGSLSLSDYFQDIYQDDPKRFDVTLRFIYLLLRTYSNHDDWQLVVSTPTRQFSYPNLLLWNMHIYRKNSASPLTPPLNYSSPK